MMAPRLTVRRPLLPIVGLIALTTAVSLETFRVLFPKAYGLADRAGNEVAAAVTVAVFACAFLMPVARRLLGRRRLLAGTAGALAVWRVVVALLGSVPLGLAIAGTVAALLALDLVLTSEHAGGAELAGVALLSGLGLDVAIRSAFSTWDPAWQRGAASIVVGVALSGALALSVVGALRGDWGRTGAGPPVVRTFGGGVGFGALLALEVGFLLSPGYVASSAGASLAWSVLVVMVSIAVAMAVLALSRRLDPILVVLGAGAVLAATGFLLPRATGGVVVLAVVAGQVAAGGVLGVIVRSRTTSGRSAELGLGLGWIVFVLVVLLYQLHFDQPLPFDNRWIIAGGGALTLLAAFGRDGRTPAVDGHLAPLATAVLLVVAALLAAGLGVTDTDRAVASGPPATLRVVEWNVRQAVTETDGDLAPDKVASVLTRDGPPDIVVLPEVARGWPLSGDLDLASWLSRRLDLPFRWAPAADRQFGTLLLSRLPIVSARVVRLPVAGRAQGRSLLHATLALGGGERLTVLATHLQHRNDVTSVAARSREIPVILDAWNGGQRTLLLGDFNPRQGDPPGYPTRRPGEFPEIRTFLDAGFTAGQDLETCSQPTSGRNCSDFVLVTPDLRQEVSVDTDAGAFDHRPVRSQVHLR